MSEPKSPVDRALDLVFFAPLGLAIAAREDFPKTVETARTRVASQVMVARMLGEMAVKEGQRRASKAVKQSAEALVNLGILPGPVPPARVVSSEPVVPEPPVTGVGPSANGGPRPSTASADLAIPGYDSLSASQVVQRLAGLAAEELEAVRTYEATGRGRRTILNKIAQLQSERS